MIIAAAVMLTSSFERIKKGTMEIHTKAKLRTVTYKAVILPSPSLFLTVKTEKYKLIDALIKVIAAQM
ncbi:hypothetical protein [Planococcus chinensis]|uniref:hypothetical protein n=1 Tax=Planococcus chinensis TaxID=272917 RepID=UPI001CC41F6B|nr:hypothetical protein [Planococcus chinensis]